MIEVEIEDETWVVAVPDAEALVKAACGAAIASFETLPAVTPQDDEEGCVAKNGRHGEERSEAARLEPRMGIAVLLTDDATVRDLNARFRSKDAPTNVLSFPAPANPEGHLGDIALAYGVCAAEAAAQHKPLAHHLQHLVAHGVLHLIGYDHQSDAEAEVMEALERRVLAGLGVPDPYAERVPDAGHA